MNSNHNVKKTVGTSIVTLLIIAFGLFLVCGVRPPQPTIEDSSIDSAQFGDEELGSDDLAEFLDDSGGGDDLGIDSQSNDDFAADESASSDDSDMNDILKLLDSDDSASDDDDDLFAFDESDFSGEDNSGVELASVTDVTRSASSSEEADQFEGALTNEAYDELTQEADRLNQVLEEKNEIADSLKEVLETYDEKIAVMELENSGVGSQYTPSPTYNSQAPASTSSSSYASDESYSSTSTPRSSGSSFSSRYDTAINKFTSGKYSQALRKFEELISKEPSNQLADNCQFWIGECYLAMKDYTRAVLEFEKVFAYDDNENADDAQFKIGLSFLEEGNRKMARQELDTLLDFYADSELVREARSHLQRL